MQTDVETKKDKMMACKDHVPFKGSLKELDALIGEIKTFLKNNQSAPVGKDVKSKVDSLSSGISACKGDCPELPSSLVILTADIRDRIKLAVEERERLEDEGGIVADRKQSATDEELVKILRKLDCLFPSVEEIQEKQN